MKLSPVTLRDSKVRVAKDHGKKFRSRLAASFSGIILFAFGILAMRMFDLVFEQRTLCNNFIFGVFYRNG